MAKANKQPKTPKGVKGPAATAWWEEAEEVPRAGLPDAQKLTKKAKRLRIFVWASVILCPLSLFTTFVTVAGAGGSPAPITSGPDEYADTRPEAMVAVADWLSQTPSPLPGGHVVAWESASTDKAPPADDESTSPAYTVEVHHLSVADGSGHLYDSVVSLATSDNIGTVVIGKPSLIALAPNADSFDGTDWPNQEPAHLNDDMERAITEWSAAYTNRDPAILRSAIHETSGSRSYATMYGATLSNPQFGDAFGVWPTDAESKDGTPKKVVVRVTFDIAWINQPVPAEGAELPTVSYDVLLHGADTASPYVVAWGGPGSGPDLKAGANAVTGRQIVAPEEIEVPEPTSTPTAVVPVDPPTNQPKPNNQNQQPNPKKADQ